MRIRRLRVRWWLVAGLGLLVIGVVLAATPPSAGAQCGSDASSCKQCHEGQGQYPVKELGAWHVDHAANDFCQFCHGGDPDADDAVGAHAGMVEALSDPAAQCATCHPADFGDKTAGYVDLLASTGGTSSGGDAGFWAADAPASDSGDAGFWAADGAATVQAAPVTTDAASVAVAADDTTDWRNPLLAGIAGFLTAVSGMTVWSLQGWGDKMRARHAGGGSRDEED